MANKVDSYNQRIKRGLKVDSTELNIIVEEKVGETGITGIINELNNEFYKYVDKNFVDLTEKELTDLLKNGTLYVFKNGNTMLFELIMNKKYDKDSLVGIVEYCNPNQNGDTELHALIRMGRSDILMNIIKRRGVVNVMQCLTIENDSKQDCLMLLCEAMFKEVLFNVIFLNGVGSIINRFTKPDVNGLTGLYWLSRRKMYDVSWSIIGKERGEPILKHFVVPDKQGGTPLDRLCQINDVGSRKLIKYMLLLENNKSVIESFSQVNTLDGRNALSYLASSRQIVTLTNIVKREGGKNVVEHFVVKPFDNRVGKTAGQYLITHGYTKLIETIKGTKDVPWWNVW